MKLYKTKRINKIFAHIKKNERERGHENRDNLMGRVMLQLIIKIDYYLF